MNPITSIADRLTFLLRNREFVNAYQELFDNEAVSVDPLNNEPGDLKGLPVLISREIDFLSKAQILDLDVSQAIIAGSYFAISLFMRFDIGGQEMTIDELCIYKVRKGKIISQQFLIAEPALT